MHVYAFVLCVDPSGRKVLKVGALPTENLPAKSIPKPVQVQRHVIVKHPLPIPIVHKDFESVRKSIKKHYWDRNGSDWNFSFYTDKVYMSKKFRSKLNNFI